jgi:hypothetical protein
VQADNAQRPPLVEPRDQLVAAADAQAAEIEDVKPVAAPFAQRDALQGFDVVVEGRADKDADLKIWAVGLPPIVEPMYERFEARKRERTALSRLRDQTIAADMSAGRMPQRKPQPLSDDFPRHP